MKRGDHVWAMDIISNIWHRVRLLARMPSGWTVQSGSGAIYIVADQFLEKKLPADADSENGFN
jgi:hypothetical protein